MIFNDQQKKKHQFKDFGKIPVHKYEVDVNVIAIDVWYRMKWNEASAAWLFVSFRVRKSNPWIHHEHLILFMWTWLLLRMPMGMLDMES